MKIVVVAASAGGLSPLRQIIGALPSPCGASVFVVMHIGDFPSSLPSILDRPDLRARFGEAGASIEPSHVYVAPPGSHMMLERGRIRLNQGAKIHHTRPAADPLFESAARSYGKDVVGIVLSGGDGDGAAGLVAIKAHGGLAMIQDPKEATAPGMPLSALTLDHPALCLPASEIAREVARFCGD